MVRTLGLGIALLMAVGGTANAGYKSKDSISNRVTFKTKAAQSTVVGRTAKSTFYYVRSEGTKNGSKYVVTRMVNTNTGKIVNSKNALPKAKQTVALKNHNGAVGGQSGDFAYSVRSARNSMTAKGNIKIFVDNSGFPGRTEGRIVTLTKSGAIKQVKDSPVDGLKSRW
jgi:hypothetical protein